jgi:hypothetical protein
VRMGGGQTGAGCTIASFDINGAESQGYCTCSVGNIQA